VIVKIVPLPVMQGLKFDVILPDGYIVTVTMDEYEVRSYRGSVADVISAKVLDWMQVNDYSDSNVEFIFC
jgi:hypothetical protein